MKKIALGVIALALAFSFTVASADSYNFQSNLTVGSRGNDVSTLQTLLISQGYLTAVSAPTGYFGTATQAALGKWQAANGISPTAGYFGSISRAKLNGSSTTVVSTVPGCSAGALFSSTTGAACTTSTTVAGCVAGALFSSTTGAPCSGSTTVVGGVITTPGVEGTINVTQESSGVKSSVYEGDSQDAVLGFKVEAKTSDALVQRVKVQIGSSTNAYTKVFSKIYLTDAAGTILASKDLNSSTVDRESSSVYTVTLTGFNALVKKDTKASFYIKFDLSGSISSEYRVSQTISIPDQGVRASDGAGIDQYGAGSISRSVSISKSLADSASLTLSTDPDVLKAQTVVANSGSANNEADLVTVASFRALAEKDSVLVRDLSITASSTAGQATEPTAYLYDGSTQIASASGSTNGTSTTYSFTSIDQTIQKDATKTYTIKVDVRDGTTVADIFAITGVSVDSAESASTGTTVSVNSLSSVGNNITFVSQGVVTTPSSATIAIVTTKDQNGVTTEAHLTSTFNVAINAIGADATFGAPADAFKFKVFKNGVDVTSTVASHVTVYYPSTQPSGTNSNYNSATGFTVSRNGNTTIPVGFKVDVTGSSTVASDFPSGDYSVRLNSIVYTVNGDTVTNDNSTNSAWVTNTTQRP